MEPTATRHALRATVHKHLGNTEKALPDLEKAIAIETDAELSYLQAADLDRTNGSAPPP